MSFPLQKRPFTVEVDEIVVDNGDFFGVSHGDAETQSRLQNSLIDAKKTKFWFWLSNGTGGGQRVANSQWYIHDTSNGTH